VPHRLIKRVDSHTSNVSNCDTGTSIESPKTYLGQPDKSIWFNNYSRRGALSLASSISALLLPRMISSTFQQESDPIWSDFTCWDDYSGWRY
jgi:hypothetical protein